MLARKWASNANIRFDPFIHANIRFDPFIPFGQKFRAMGSAEIYKSMADPLAHFCAIEVLQQRAPMP